MILLFCASEPWVPLTNERCTVMSNLLSIVISFQTVNPTWSKLSLFMNIWKETQLIILGGVPNVFVSSNEEMHSTQTLTWVHRLYITLSGADTSIMVKVWPFEFFTLRISVRLSDRSYVTQIKINFVKNCGIWTHNLLIISPLLYQLC